MKTAASRVAMRQLTRRTVLGFGGAALAWPITQTTLRVRSCCAVPGPEHPFLTGDVILPSDPRYDAARLTSTLATLVSRW